MSTTTHTTGTAGAKNPNRTDRIQGQPLAGTRIQFPIPFFQIVLYSPQMGIRRRRRLTYQPPTMRHRDAGFSLRVGVRNRPIPPHVLTISTRAGTPDACCRTLHPPGGREPSAEPGATCILDVTR